MNDGSGLTALLRSAQAMLSNEAVPGVEKWDLLATIVERVVCRKEGADVVFLPGVFETLGEENGTNSTLYTTCMVCQVRQGTCTFLAHSR